MKKLNLNNFLKNEVSANVATLLSGSVIGQFIVFVLTPILTRLYSDELFGIYFIFVSTFNILKKVTTLRFEIAIVVPKNDSWAINAFAITIFFAFITSIIFFGLCFLLKDILSQWYKINKIIQYIYLLPISLLFFGIFEAFSYWNNRFKNYKIISSSKATYSSSIGIVQILLSKYLQSSLGLILGNIFGIVISTILIVILSIKRLIKFINLISIKRMLILLRIYKKIPTYNTLINLITNFSSEIPVYLFTAFYSPAVSGWYGMANKITGTPLDMLSQSIGQVFFQKAAEKYNNKELKELTKKTIKKLFRISLIFTAFTILIAPFIDFLLGKDWQKVEIILIILAPAVLANFLLQPISAIPTIINKQNIYLVYTISFTVLKILGIWIGFAAFDNYLASIILFSAITTISKLFLVKWTYDRC